MAKKKGLSRPAKMFWGLLAAVLIAIIGIWGYNRYMEKKKVEQLYQHGFQLLEEQTALYIKENYSGISKIEFSPIFVDGDGRFTMRTVNVVPVVYDEEGNKAILGGTIGHHSYAGYGILEGIMLDFDGNGGEIIELAGRNGKMVEVQQYQHLPTEAQLRDSQKIDENILALIEDGQLKGVEKKLKGSPSCKIDYNLEIKKGEYWKWQP
ncbi:hypothetical protein DDV21_002630 [Streptococcus chenjunshii]|uniref:Uncharacterized protein n=1 Tax=Streptococcus chenjunshii TaxID=2173853 RepID=A0A372KK14_9STRE|nr:hypothetical protein [Streptococcus chenjunshii]AXQ78043.1 hypothetical protein DDV21_002630 [Streptococcus chenjunshii]RFU50414.1 hypothetical protein DDV22_08665 [Streptococcus chenjunshii]RFU52642.1 hypothetical protein DDV23_08505 [Streptococcus chenjunshii]